MKFVNWLNAFRHRATRRAHRSRVALGRVARLEVLESRAVLSAPHPLDLSTLNGTNGFRLDGIDADDGSGFSASNAGDVNGDGFDDLVIGAINGDPNGERSAGESYVVFGKSSGFTAALDLSTLNGTNGFRLDGIDAFDSSGTSVSSAGDVNGDGFDDLLIGAFLGDPNGDTNAGESYVVFGKSSGFAAVLDLSMLNGTNGFRLDGIDPLDSSGASVSSAGDVNGDGFDDLIIGAFYGDPNGDTNVGESYVVFGKSSGFAAALDLSTLNGTNGFRLVGIDAFDKSGASVSSAGDVNGDGFDDLIIGALGGDPNGKSYAGESYVVFGKSSGFAAVLDLSTLNGTNGFRLEGIDIQDYSGLSVSNAGDVNGDGFDDLIIGAFGGDPNGDINAGESYLLFGKSSGFAAALNLSMLDGTTGFQINGIEVGDQSAWSVSNAGDVNGDGFDDLVIGGQGGDPNGDSFAGETYVVFGKSSGFAAVLNLSLLDGTIGFRLDGIDSDDRSGSAVSSAGDVNGDGFDDLIIGAFGGDPNGDSYAGESYVVFGGNFTGGVETQVGTSGSNMLTANQGVGAKDVLIGQQGADTLISDGGADVLYGGEGSDTLAIVSTAFQRVAGGNGTDTLRLDGSGITLDLSRLADNKLTDIEVINLTGSGNNTLTLNQLEVLNVSSTSNTLLVFGDAGDSVIQGRGWTRGADELIEADTFAVFTQGAATLKVQSTVTATVFRSAIDLSALDGTNGFRLDGFDRKGYSGRSVSSAGDVNGDGFDDLLIGARYADSNGNSYVGESYVVFGKSCGFAATLELSALDGTTGFRLDGIDPLDRSGGSVSNAGDVNGDGFDDLLIGAFGGEPNGDSFAGESYVVFGKPSSFGAALDLSTLDGMIGFRLDGIDAGDRSGFSVSSAGDVNGDGLDDLLIGAYGGAPNGDSDAGESYVVFGKSSGFAAVLDLSTLDGTSGFRLDGIDASDRSGRSVSSAGDVNGDGFADLLIGAHYGDPNGDSDAGESYVVFGKSSNFGAVLDLATLDGTTGFRIDGIDASDISGRSVSSAGDVNGDGFDDLLIGAAGADGFAGESYLVFGKSSGFGAALELSTLNGSNGFRLDGVDPVDFSGFSVSNAGDVNGDGFDDLVIGGQGGDPNGDSFAGESYVVFGKSNGFAAAVDLSTLDGTNGFRLDGIDPDDLSGSAVSSAGDVNGDGFDDLIIGAFGADPNGDSFAGESYVVFGGNFTGGAETQVGTSGSNTLTANQGVNAKDVLIGQQGADTLISDGGADVLYGGEGDDTLVIASTAFQRVAGGNGSDTLRVDGAGLTLNLTTLADNKLTSIETIDLRGTGANSLTLNVLEVLNITSGSNAARTANTLIVRRDSDDLINMGTGWSQGANVIFGSTQFQTFTQGQAKLHLEIPVLITATLDGGRIVVRAPQGIALDVMVSRDAGTQEIVVGSRSGNVVTTEFRFPISSVTGGLDATLSPQGDRFDASLAGLPVTVNGGDGNDSLMGGTANDQLVGGNGDDTLTGGLGQDTLQAGASGLDLLFEIFNADLTLTPTQLTVISGGNTVVDSLSGFEKALILGGGSANRLDASLSGMPVTLFGGSGNDVLIGGNQADSLDGQGGNDTMTGGAGVDSFVGGAGNDTLKEVFDQNLTLTNSTLLAAGNGQANVTDKLATMELADLSGGASRNKIDLSGFAASLGATINGSGQSDTIIGSPGPDMIITLTGADVINGLGGADVVFSGSGNDTINGGDGIDNINGQNGDDLISGDAGNDVLVGGAGRDTLNGGADNDFLSGQTDPGLLNGGDGNDVLQGNAANDTLNGDAGDDRLLSLQGDDLLSGGDGADTLFGGIGNDSLLGGAGADDLRGEAGSDLLNGGADADRVNEVLDTNVTITGTVASSQIATGSLGVDSVSNVERINLTGGLAANFFDARTANLPVLLSGDAGNDTLLGGSKSDVISGGDGDDVLSGGAGTDVIDGGNGTDYVYEKADTNLTVNGVTITSSITGTDTPTTIERIALIGGTGANKLDASLATISVVLIGGPGNDTLLGGSGADTLSGGNRNDATVVGGDGADSLDGGAGNDTLENDPLDTKVTGAGDTTIADVFALLPSWIDAL